MPFLRPPLSPLRVEVNENRYIQLPAEEKEGSSLLLGACGPMRFQAAKDTRFLDPSIPSSLRSSSQSIFRARSKAQHNKFIIAHLEEESSGAYVFI